MANLNEMLQQALQGQSGQGAAQSADPYYDPDDGSNNPYYDPVALAEYIKRTKTSGKVPLFTDDYKLAEKEGGFYIDTRTNVATGTRVQATLGAVGSSVPKTGNPVVDQINGAKAELIGLEAQLNQDLNTKLSNSQEAKNIAKIDQELARLQMLGRFADPAQLQQLSAMKSLAVDSYNTLVSRTKQTPEFFERAEQIRVAKETLALRDPELQTQQELDKLRATEGIRLSTAERARVIENAPSPELSRILGTMTGVATDPETIAKERINGNITQSEFDYAVAVNEGVAQSPIHYYQTGQVEIAKAAGRYAVNSAPKEIRSELDTANQKLDAITQGALNTAQTKLNEYMSGTSEVPDNISPLINALKTTAVAENVAALKGQILGTLVQQEVASKVVQVRRDVITSNPEILRPETTWTPSEADIGNKLISLIKNDSNPKLDEKLRNATRALAETYDSGAINSVVTKMQQVYVRRFNETYSALGLVASPNDLNAMEVGVLESLFQKLGQGLAGAEFGGLIAQQYSRSIVDSLQLP